MFLIFSLSRLLLLSTKRPFPAPVIARCCAQLGADTATQQDAVEYPSTLPDDKFCINTLFPAPVITLYISESGTDTDGCGKIAETACRTMSPVFAQLLAEQTVAPHDLKMSVDKVWNKAIDNVAFLLSKQEYPGPDYNYSKLLYFCCQCFKLFKDVLPVIYVIALLNIRNSLTSLTAV